MRPRLSRGLHTHLVKGGGISGKRVRCLSSVVERPPRIADRLGRQFDAGIYRAARFQLVFRMTSPHHWRALDSPFTRLADLECVRECHPRHWGIVQAAAFRRRPRPASPNPTHGSAWIVQFLPTEGGRLDPLPQIPPTAVGGSFNSCLHPTSHPTRFPNPTHGSGWIVQVLATDDGGLDALPPNPTHASAWIVQAQPTMGGRTCFANPLRVSSANVPGAAI